MKPLAEPKIMRRNPARIASEAVRTGGGKLLSPYRKNGVPDIRQAAMPRSEVTVPHPRKKMTARLRRNRCS
jgi:hypothetical protein